VSTFYEQVAACDEITGHRVLFKTQKAIKAGCHPLVISRGNLISQELKFKICRA